MINAPRPRMLLQAAQVLGCITVAALGFGQSQPPTPGRPERNEPAQQQPTRQQDEAAPDRSLRDPTAITQLRSPHEAAPRQDAAKSGWDSPEWWMAGVTLATLAATFVIALASWQTYRVYHAILAAQKEIERAYITMSHHPPGLDVPSVTTWSGPDLPGMVNVSIRVGVRNRGNTPGELTAFALQTVLTDETLPDRPAYDADSVTASRIHLVKGSNFTITKNWPLPHDVVGKVHGGELHLYVIGYVDYVDRFGTRHRAGYAREYNRHAEPQNNLPFVTAPRYNYDRPREKGEGCDWDA